MTPQRQRIKCVLGRIQLTLTPKSMVAHAFAAYFSPLARPPARSTAGTGANLSLLQISSAAFDSVRRQPRALYRTLAHTHTPANLDNRDLSLRMCRVRAAHPLWTRAWLHTYTFARGHSSNHPTWFPMLIWRPSDFNLALYTGLCCYMKKPSVCFVWCGNLFCEKIAALPSRIHFGGNWKVGLGVCCFSGSEMKRKRLFLWTVSS